jgi:LPS export ABC transporter protein LptC
MRYALLLFIIMLAACDDKSAKPPRIDLLYVTNDYPVQETWEARIVFTDSGRIKAQLEAAHVMQFTRQGSTEKKMEGRVRADLYDENGMHSSTLTANRATIQSNNDIEAFEKVVIVSDDCTTVRTEYLKWTSADRKVRSDKFVTIKRPTETLSGYGFESDQSLKHYRIFKATAVMKMKDQSDLTQ